MEEISYRTSGYLCKQQNMIQDEIMCKGISPGTRSGLYGIVFTSGYHINNINTVITNTLLGV